MIFCYNHRSVLYPDIIRDAYCGSRWKQVQSLTARGEGSLQELVGVDRGNIIRIYYMRKNVFSE